VCLLETYHLVQSLDLVTRVFLLSLVLKLQEFKLEELANGTGIYNSRVKFKVVFNPLVK